MKRSMPYFAEVKQRTRVVSLFIASALTSPLSPCRARDDQKKLCSFLREAAQLDMSLHVGVTSHALPDRNQRQAVGA